MRIQNHQPDDESVSSQECFQPVRLVYSYSHRDEKLRLKLETHLALLQRQRFIVSWHDRKIPPGKEWQDEINENFDSADIILLLVSPDFIASDYCYDIEMAQALERHRNKEARVIPVILRPTEWRHAPFARIQALPKDGKPVTCWNDRDSAWLDVAGGIRRAIEELRRLTQIDFRGINEALKRFERLRSAQAVHRLAAETSRTWRALCRRLLMTRDHCDRNAVEFETFLCSCLATTRRLEGNHKGRSLKKHIWRFGVYLRLVRQFRAEGVEGITSGMSDLLDDL